MKKIILGLSLLFGMLLFTNVSVEAKEVIASDSINDMSGNPVGVIEIYDNSEIKISYKYGLRLAELQYCVEGNDCMMNIYKYEKIAEANSSESYKNETGELKSFRYKPILEEDTKYKFRVTAYFGSTSSYTGTENVNTAFMLVSLTVDTKEEYVMGSKSPNIENEQLDTMMSNLKEIVNNTVLPVIYIILFIFLIVKGALLGTQIVKNADNPDIRSEKIGALKWLLIGVAIGLSANTLIGVFTGYFSNWL